MLDGAHVLVHLLLLSQLLVRQLVQVLLGYHRVHLLVPELPRRRRLFLVVQLVHWRFTLLAVQALAA